MLLLKLLITEKPCNIDLQPFKYEEITLLNYCESRQGIPAKIKSRSWSCYNPIKTLFLAVFMTHALFLF